MKAQVFLTFELRTVAVSISAGSSTTQAILMHLSLLRTVAVSISAGSSTTEAGTDAPVSPETVAVSISAGSSTTEAGTGVHVSPEVDSPGEHASASAPYLTGSGVDALKSQVEWQGAYVRKLKEELGRSNSAHTVQAQVQILLDLNVQILQDLKRKLGSLEMKQQNLRRIGQAEEAEA
eukprot:gene12796-16054_t